MHHGTTVVHWGAEMGNRSALIFLRLDRNSGMLTWDKTSWSALRTNSGAPDFSLNTDPEDLLPSALVNRSAVNILSATGKSTYSLQIHISNNLLVFTTISI